MIFDSHVVWPVSTYAHMAALSRKMERELTSSSSSGGLRWPRSLAKESNSVVVIEKAGAEKASAADGAEGGGRQPDGVIGGVVRWRRRRSWKPSFTPICQNGLTSAAAAIPAFRHRHNWLQISSPH
jgi:hypothetical protein